jgi:molybdenum cofactor cytidylyltransferase
MGRPKALLRYGGTSFLERILSTIEASSITGTVVVLGSHRDEIVSAVRIEHPVYNPDHADGMTTSFQAGIRALGREVRGAMIFLVDHPFVSGATIEALIEEFEEGRIVLPVFHGRRGHPVLFSREVLDEILGLPHSLGVNTVVRRDPHRIREVGVEDSGVTIDIDTPDDFERWRDQPTGSPRG